MKYILLTIFLVGCQSSIRPDTWKRAEELCSGNNGVYSVTSKKTILVDVSYADIYCNNSAYFDIRVDHGKKN